MKQKSIQQLRREVAQAQEALDKRNNKQGRMDDANAFPALPKHLWKLLREQGFKTGSEVYAPGIRSADEDWCINCAPQAFKGYAAGIEDDSYFETDGFASLYAHNEHGKAINILCFSDYELFESWHKTTQVMTDLVDKSLKDFSYNEQMANYWDTPFQRILEKKWSRVRLFSALRDILWPVKALAKDMDKDEALKFRKCIRCGRRAEFFSSWPERKKYLDTGVCERCREEGIAQRSTGF